MTPVQKATQTTIGVMSVVSILVAAAYGVGLFVAPLVIWCFIDVINPWYQLLPSEIQIMVWLILSMFPVSALVWVSAWVRHFNMAYEKEEWNPHRKTI